jgi:hypothetical protein
MIVRVAAILLALGLAAPALADDYPVSGRWGQVTSTSKGPVNCTGKRIIAFSGNQRTDSKGGVPAYRNKSVTGDGVSRWRVIDIFTTGQINNATMSYTLVRTDADHIEMVQQKGGTIKLQRCQ